MLGSRTTRSIGAPRPLSCENMFDRETYASSVGRLLVKFRRTVGVYVGAQTLSALEPRTLQVIGCG